MHEYASLGKYFIYGSPSRHCLMGNELKASYTSCAMIQISKIIWQVQAPQKCNDTYK